MQVHAVTNNIYTKNLSFTPKNDKDPIQPPISTALPPKGLRAVYFGHNINVQNIEGLIKNYKWFINNDKTPAINALLKIKTDKETFDALLKTILKNDEFSYELIDSIIKQPRNMKYFLKDFEEKLPTGSDTLLTFMPYNVYTEAYTKYIDKRFQNATSISELLEIRPDWKEEVLLAKHQDIYHNNDFELGFVPDEINYGKFERIIKYIAPFGDIGHKSIKEIPPLKIDNSTYNFNFFTDGRSDKNVFGITGNNGEKFIIKVAQRKKRSLDLPFALGTLCKIDTYLTRNHCRNSAPFKYYNHKLNASVYDFIEHQKVDKKITLKNIKENIPDFIDLNMIYNDTAGYNNFFILDNTQKRIQKMNDYAYGVKHAEWITVDNDHVTFSTRFQPVIDKYHKRLPNFMGAII